MYSHLQCVRPPCAIESPFRGELSSRSPGVWIERVGASQARTCQHVTCECGSYVRTVQRTTNLELRRIQGVESGIHIYARTRRSTEGRDRRIRSIRRAYRGRRTPKARMDRGHPWTHPVQTTCVGKSPEWGVSVIHECSLSHAIGSPGFRSYLQIAQERPRSRAHESLAIETSRMRTLVRAGDNQTGWRPSF
jgi:hypothetical protein